MTDLAIRPASLTVEPAILQAIGRCIVHFAHLEQELDHLIWSFMAGANALASSPHSLARQKAGMTKTANLLFHEKLKELRTLVGAHEVDESVRSLLTKFLDTSKVAGERRNLIMHAAWTSQGYANVQAGLQIPPGVAVSAKPQADGTYMLWQRAQEDLAEFADGLAGLRGLLRYLHTTLFPA